MKNKHGLICAGVSL